MGRKRQTHCSRGHLLEGDNVVIETRSNGKSHKKMLSEYENCGFIYCHRCRYYVLHEFERKI